MTSNKKRLLIASPHGFCVGVTRAVKTAEAVCEKFEPPIYCYHEIVHNEHVVSSLKKAGVIFVDDINLVPEGATLLFSAHGISPEIKAQAEKRNLKVFDATCPFVLKVHNQVKRYAAENYTVFLIGYAAHQEVVGVVGEAPDNVMVIETEDDARTVQPRNPELVSVVTQTTLSLAQTGKILDILREKFPKLVQPNKRDICYATENRQKAVQVLAEKCDYVIVLGSQNSSNSKRLCEVAASEGCKATLVNCVEQIDDLPLENIQTFGVTSGASAPEEFLLAVIDKLKNSGFNDVEELVVIEEDVKDFRIPV